MLPDKFVDGLVLREPEQRRRVATADRNQDGGAVLGDQVSGEIERVFAGKGEEAKERIVGAWFAELGEQVDGEDVQAVVVVLPVMRRVGRDAVDGGDEFRDDGVALEGGSEQGGFVGRKVGFVRNVLKLAEDFFGGHWEEW